MTLYEKRGRRYHPVHDSAAREGLSNGSWLVDVADGRTIIHRAIDEKLTLEQLAAVPALTEWICSELREWSRARPERPLTSKEKRAWDAYCEIMGPESTMTLTIPAAWDVAENVARRIAELAKKGANR